MATILDNPKIGPRYQRAMALKNEIATWRGTPRLERFAAMRHRGAHLALNRAMLATRAGLDPDAPTPEASAVAGVVTKIGAAIEGAKFDAALLELPALGDALRAHATAVGAKGNETDELVTQVDLALQAKDAEAAGVALDALLEAVGLPPKFAKPKPGSPAALPAAGAPVPSAPPMTTEQRLSAHDPVYAKRLAALREASQAVQACRANAWRATPGDRSARDAELRMQAARNAYDEHCQWRRTFNDAEWSMAKRQGLTLQQVEAARKELSPALYKSALDHDKRGDILTLSIMVQAQRQTRATMAANTPAAVAKRAAADRVKALENKLREAAQEERFWRRCAATEPSTSPHRTTGQRCAATAAQRFEALKGELRNLAPENPLVHATLAAVAPPADEKPSPLPPDVAPVVKTITGLGAAIDAVVAEAEAGEVTRSASNRLRKAIDAYIDEAAPADDVADALEELAAAAASDVVKRVTELAPAVRDRVGAPTRLRMTLRSGALPSGTLPTEFRLFVFGWNASTKGEILFDERAAADVMTAFDEHGVDVMIDLEHLSLTEGESFDPDARGWCRLELRDGELWAVDVKWTDDGAERLSQRRQRYVSPAFWTDPETKRVREITNIAITAMPATHGAPPLIAASRRAG